jgi:DRTGG domain
VSLVVVTSKLPGEGKTGVAAAIARHYAYTGTPVRLVRVASEQGNASPDAAFFSSCTFAPGSPASAVEASAVVDPGAGSITVVEADAASAAAISGATVVLVCCDKPGTLAGLSPGAIVVTCASVASNPDAAPPVIALSEDRSLAGFSVDEAKAILNAETIVLGDPDPQTCDYLVIAPIASDAGQPYFRRFDTKAVVVRFDKTDMHLAAMQADPACLILTGGRRPSDYLFDAASAKGIPVLLSRTDTENTVIAMERVFDRTRFQGERKLDRMASLLDASPLFTALGI